MNNLLRLVNCKIYGSFFNMSYRFASDSGSGKAGSIREAGGAFAKREAAQEEEYFHRQQREQIQKLKDSIADEIKFHEEQIKRHREAIERNKKKVEDVSKEN